MAGKPKKWKKSRQDSRPEKPDGPMVLRNPHAVFAALESRPDDVIEVAIKPDQLTPAWRRVAELAHSLGRPVVEPRPQQDFARGRDERASAATATVKPKPQTTLNRMLKSDQETGLWLALEHVQDPHNVGAILRTAAFFGVRGVVLTKDRSASITPIAYDISAGGVEAVEICTVTNMSRTIDAAHDHGLWVLGTSEHAEVAVSAVEKDRKWLVVVGNEEQGLRRLTKERCDVVASIPCLGSVTSLNVSVATGIVLSHVASHGEE